MWNQNNGSGLFCFSVLMSIKYDSDCQVITDKPGRYSAPSQFVPYNDNDWH